MLLKTAHTLPCATTHQRTRNESRFDELLIDRLTRDICIRNRRTLFKEGVGNRFPCAKYHIHRPGIVSTCCQFFQPVLSWKHACVNECRPFVRCILCCYVSPSSGQGSTFTNQLNLRVIRDVSLN